MGLTVERTIFVGIFVVIVAILGIAISGAMDPEGSLFGVREGTVSAHTDDDETPVLLRDSDDEKRAEAARRQQELVQRRDNAIREMTNSKGPVVKGKPKTTPFSIKSEDVTPVLRRSAPIEPEETAPPEAQPAGTIEYVVEPGDSLWKIARKHYGDGDIKRIVDIILAANPTVDADHIKAGITVLTLPVKLPDNVQTPPVLKKATTKTEEPSVTKPLNSTATVPKYEVRSGDSLRRIAKRELGEENRWDEIYELNRAYLEAPEKIHPGMTLLMPER